MRALLWQVAGKVGQSGDQSGRAAQRSQQMEQVARQRCEAACPARLYGALCKFSCILVSSAGEFTHRRTEGNCAN